MPKIIISGCNGRMGRVISAICSQREGLQAVAGFDLNTEKTGGFPVYADPMEYMGPADVLVDFSSPATLAGLLAYCQRRRLPAVLCTTGYSKEQLEAIGAASARIPIFRSANMSLGINLLNTLLKKAAAVLGDTFDVEIVERHHKNKVDSPSGTALMLADTLAASLPHPSEYVFDRSGVRQPRGKYEIGISAVRGGSIVGEHEVIFAGADEVIEFRHTAYSRDVFANGAVTAAIYMAGVSEPGLYDMNDALESILGK